MANDFFERSGIWNNEKYSVPRQTKYNKNGEKWEEFMYWKLETHKHYYFFNDRVHKEGLKIEHCPKQMKLTEYLQTQ